MNAMRKPTGKLKNCKSCGKVFVSEHGEVYCKECAPIEEQKERILYNYIRDHPGEPIIDVMRAIKQANFMKTSDEVENFLFNEGLVEGEEPPNTCASCGKPIAKGLTYCKECFNVWMKTVKVNRPSSDFFDQKAQEREANRAAAMKDYKNRPYGPGQSPPSKPEPEHVDSKYQRYRGIIGTRGDR